MAIFNIIANHAKKEDINEVYSLLSELPRSVVSVFPVISPNLEEFNGVGITASGTEITKLFQVKEELISILNFLWERDFIIRELYNGKILTKETFKRELDYFWNFYSQP